MIKTFHHKGLADLWAGRANKIAANMRSRVLLRLDALDAATTANDMNIPGFDFHRLRGFRPPRYTVHVNGPWCITFQFDQGDAFRVDFEQYH